MKTNRSLFLSGFSGKSALIMHCTSRIVGREFLLGEVEKEAFVKMMRMYEEFCGVKVLSYCVMSNHFHILLEIPPQAGIEEMRQEMSDGEFLAKLSGIYSVAYVKEVRKQMQLLNKNQATKAMRELKEKYTYRMGNMSEFMKSLKQRFSRWYNKLHGRRGTLWEERYSATAVSAGSAARMVAAYIDLNPLRAGLTACTSSRSSAGLACTSSRSSAGDSKDYRWCSYAEAVAGDVRAVEGYVRLYEGSDRAGAEAEKLTSDPVKVLERYRMLMAEEGAEAEQDALPMVQGQRASKRHKRRRGYSREEIDAILEKNGALSRAEMLRCKTRYFTDGAVIGSKAFVNGFFERVKDRIPGKSVRKSGGKKMRGFTNVQNTRGVEKIDSGVMYSYRDLQKNVLG